MMMYDDDDRRWVTGEEDDVKIAMTTNAKW